MQQFIIYTQPEESKNAISYEYAKQLKKLSDLESKYEKDKETARYLYGKKRGAWGRITQADIKRSENLTQLQSKIKNLKSKLNLTQ